MTTTDLDPVSGEIELRPPYLPLAPATAKQAMAAYQELCAAVLTPDDWIGRPGEAESFVKKSGWITLATFYGASVELVGDTILERDADGKLLRAESKARATSRDGRVFEGRGACGVNEPRFANARGRQKVEHDLPATADTRATNRAIASLIGFGAVSAEEIDADVRGKGEAPDLPEWAADVADGQVDRLGENLEAILVAGGVPAGDATRVALAIGSKITNYAGGVFPRVGALLAHLLARAVTTPAVEVVEPDDVDAPDPAVPDDVDPEGRVDVYGSLPNTPEGGNPT